MRELVLVTLYGGLFLLGLFLMVFWFVLARKRATRIAGRWTKRSDRYFMLASAIAVMSLGDSTVFLGRTIATYRFGMSPGLQSDLGTVVATGLLIVLVGKFMLVWLADLEKEPPVWTWTRWGVVLTAIWCAVAVSAEVFR